jgi:hypothetical protein
MSQVFLHSRRAFVLALLIVSGLLLGACGNKQDTRTLGETEGVYVTVADLTYQVQISRVLNPADVEDQSYFEGLAPEVTPPARDETWFGVFMRVSNPTDRVLDPTSQFSIVDTQENEFEPVPVDNVFAYRPEALRGGVVYPDPDSVAGQGVIQGTMLLFKVKIASLQNRPLELKIESEVTPPSEAIVDLDV